MENGLQTINKASDMKFNSLILGKASDEGFKVDLDTPTYSWEDQLGPIIIRGLGAADPSWTNYKGNISQYEFSVNDLVTNMFHITHEYALGTDIYLHIHWSHDSATVTTGAPTFECEVTWSKGHNQEAFGTNITTTISENASTTQYQHMITEVQLSAASPSASQLDSDDLEIDGLLLIRTKLTANTMDGSAKPFIHNIDLHFQSTGIGTKNKAPNFYGA